MIDKQGFEPDHDSLIQISKPIFYGYIFLSGISILVAPKSAGMMMGVAVMAAVGFISAGLADSLEEEWGRFMEIISIVAIMGAVLSSAYMAALLAIA